MIQLEIKFLSLTLSAHKCLRVYACMCACERRYRSIMHIFIVKKKWLAKKNYIEVFHQRKKLLDSGKAFFINGLHVVDQYIKFLSYTSCWTGEVIYLLAGRITCYLCCSHKGFILIVVLQMRGSCSGAVFFFLCMFLFCGMQAAGRKLAILTLISLPLF